VPDSGPTGLLRAQLGSLEKLRYLSEDKANYAYADGKWSVKEVLGLEWIEGGSGAPEADTDDDGNADPIETSLEWGVRSLGKKVSVNAEGDLPAEATADVFPAYDDDGGLLLVLTPE